MNNDVVLALLNFLANLTEVEYSDFEKIKSNLSVTQYAAYFEDIFESAEQHYKSYKNKLPDLAWLTRQHPAKFSTFIPITFHYTDTAKLSDYLCEEAYSNKIASAASQRDFKKTSDLLSKYNQEAGQIIEAPTKIKDVFSNFYKDRELLGDGIKTGILPLDADIDYLPYKGFTAIVAPTKSFKTTLACNITYDAVISQKKNVVYLTLEDQYKSVWANLFCKHSYQTGFGLSTSEIKKYKLSKEREILFESMQKNFDESMTGKLVVLSSENLSSFTPDIIESQLRYYERLWGSIDMVVADHLSIMDDPIPGQNLSGPALSKAYVRFLTKLCINFSEKGFVFLGLGQVTREYTEALARGDKMRATGVANTSEMERSASIMLCTYASDEMKKSNNLSITIVVNRNGPDGISYIIPIKPEYSVIGECFPDIYDDEISEAILNGNLDIPIKKNLAFGISFTQFQNNLKNL